MSLLPVVLLGCLAGLAGARQLELRPSGEVSADTHASTHASAARLLRRDKQKRHEEPVNSSQIKSDPAYEVAHVLHAPPMWANYISSSTYLAHGLMGAAFSVMVTCPPMTLPTTIVVKKCLNDKVQLHLELDNERAALNDVTIFLNSSADNKDTENLSPFISYLLAEPVTYKSYHRYTYLAMPYFEKGPMENYRGRTVSEKHGFVLHAIKGLKLLHKVGWIHGDLHPGNIMLSCSSHSRRSRNAVGDCHASIIDFGMACRIGTMVTDCPTWNTNLYSAAPENILNTSMIVDPKIDVWALGVMLFRLHFHGMPMPNSTTLQEPHVQSKLAKKPTLKELLEGSLSSLPSERWDVSKVEAHLKRLAPESMQEEGKFQGALVTAPCLQSSSRFPLSLLYH